MKILLLTPRLPYPPYRGDKLKIYNLIKQLSPRHEITLFTFVTAGDRAEDIEPLRKLCKEVKVFKLPVWKSILNCAGNLFSEIPFQVAYYSSGGMSNAFKAELESRRYDIAHVHFIRGAQYALEHSPAIPAVLDLTDAGSLYLERFLNKSKNVFQRIFLREELRRLRLYERNLERFDSCLVCSTIDRDALLRRAPKATIELLYNGVDLEYFSPDDAVQCEPDRIILTGNMSYFPNLDGALYFIEEIFPIIRKSRPGAKVYIVGQNPPTKLRRMSGHNVIVTGFVPDIKEHYLKSTVAVSPIRFGAGTLNKVLEPMALGVAVVATSVSVMGLAVVPGKDVLVADTSEEFAAEVIRLLNDSNLRTKVSQSAKNIVRSTYDWKTIALKLENVYAELLHK
jgi:sugar transferase (PEP-CTERM/EpsH1 system associated)